MVEIELESEKGEHGDDISACIDQSEVGIENHGPVLRKEPSFSRWFDEVGLERLYSSSENANASVEDSDFELPLLQRDGSENGYLDREEHGSYEAELIDKRSDKFGQRSILLNGALLGYLHSSSSGVSSGGEMDPVNIQIEGNGTEKELTPFEIENQHGRPATPRFRGREVGLDFKIYNGSDERGMLEATQVTQSCISTATVLWTLFYILVWYTFSTCLTLYNKSLLGDKLGKFPAPFLMNTVHFTLQAVLSRVILYFWSQRFPPSGTMSWKDFLIRVVPTALGTALDINLSNASLVFISVTFATMCKSASPIFLLLFAFAFKLESPSIKLMGIIFIISVGVLLTVAKDTEFEIWGFIFVMLAAVMSGFRWSMTQILLQKEVYGLKNPLVFMSYVTPVMAVATALLSLLFDPWVTFQKNDYFDNSWHILRSCLLMLIGGALAFFMVLTEYILISKTSAVTVTIAGVVKEAFTILVAVFYFHDHFTLLKGIGLFTIMVGVSLFNWYKYQKLQTDQVRENGGESGLSNANGAAKYVILEDMDDQDEAA